MNAWGKAFLIILFVVLVAAVGLLIAASVQGMNIVDFVQSWFESGTETTPVDETVEATRLFINTLKF